ncbi:MAG: DNA repair protein RadA [Candidatus Omnitrophica bacterium]|nr:DNA repair protein RadA [Candidatus Omnitrophota bacterium]
MFNCSECGYTSVKWLGKCPLCEGWETFVQKIEEKKGTKKRLKEKNPPKLFRDIEGKDLGRIPTGLAEFDRILGGGLVEGEVILIGGAPGVGKSTLLLEVSSSLSSKGKTLYVSAEESPQQIGLRAKRLGKSELDNIYIVGEDRIEDVFEYIKKEKFKFVVIDSIQVVHTLSCEGNKGSVSQIRGCADYLTQIAKSLGVVIFIVGHVTKDGAIAGPKLLEHIVDCVLYFEGEVLSNYRILRSIKNRFGSTGDIAVFEMKSTGLEEVKKISDLFLPHREQSFSGSCVICAIEGLRPLLIELQSLVTRSNFGIARRRSQGFDFNRFSLLVAIIEKRAKLSLSSEDVFLNVAGGLRINDPAADLGAVMAIISSFKDKVTPISSVFIGEIGLAGELRRVNNINLRLKEVERANFKHCIIPEANLKEVDKKISLEVCGFNALSEVIKDVFK